MTQETKLPLAVRLRDDAGPPLPQMVAQRRMQLERDRAGTLDGVDSLERHEGDLEDRAR